MKKLLHTVALQPLYRLTKASSSFELVVSFGVKIVVFDPQVMRQIVACNSPTLNVLPYRFVNCTTIIADDNPLLLRKPCN